MLKNRQFLHPIVIFIFSLLALGASLFLYIHSYLKVNQAFTDFVIKNKLDSAALTTESWVMILILSLLVALIVLGMFLIFVYYQKLIALYRRQQNFINGFTHELKTPVASLKLFIETFLKYELGREEQIKYLEIMMRDTERLSDNINEILNLAKIEDKSYRSEIIAINVESYLNELIKKYQLGKLKITIINKAKPESVMRIDKHLADMLFSNLITNAAIYNHNENPTLEIIIEEDDSTFHFSFKDNGVGLAQNELKNIFKKFYQVGKTTKGSGLGLYIVSQILRLHGGKIRAYSDGKDKGSTFKMGLPKHM
jgi:two-component system phosphate regulon sensor histidine kinase PhoR